MHLDKVFRPAPSDRVRRRRYSDFQMLYDGNCAHRGPRARTGFASEAAGHAVPTGLNTCQAPVWTGDRPDCRSEV